MKLRFFGDSWCWSWAFDVPGPLANAIISKRSHDYGASLPLLSWFLTGLGIDCEIVGKPGSAMRNIHDFVINTTNNDGVNYNIVFVSSPYRSVNINELPLHNYDSFMKQWNDELVDTLQGISRWAEEHNQVVFIVGGQTTITKEVFDMVGAGKNMHLLSECLVSEFTQKGKPFGIFKLADFTKDIDTRFDRELVDHIYHDVKEFTSNEWRDLVTWPDNAHLNPTGTFMLINIVLRKIEELEK